MMTKNKVIHARIDDDLHESFLEKCNELGCNCTEYLESLLRDSIENDGSENNSEASSESHYDLELDHGKVTTKEGKFIGYLKGFMPKATVEIIES